MISEPKNIPLKGLFPLPDELADASTQARAAFWKLIGVEALRLKRLEVLAGVNRFGIKFKPVKRKWGDPTPLLPHGKASRTYRLLSLNSSAQGATLYWKSEGGGDKWPTILGYHAYQHGPRSLPIRDELGLTQKSVNQLMAQTEIWKAGYEAGLEWASKHPKDLKFGKSRIPSPERFPTSKAAYERELARSLKGRSSEKKLSSKPSNQRKQAPTREDKEVAKRLKEAFKDRKLKNEWIDYVANNPQLSGLESSYKSFLEKFHPEVLGDGIRIVPPPAKEEIKPPPKSKPEPKRVETIAPLTSGPPKLDGSVFRPDLKMKDRLATWEEGDKLHAQVLDATAESRKQAKLYEERSVRIRELLYGVQTKENKKEMERLIQLNKETKEKIERAKSEAVHHVINAVAIPKEEQSKPIINLNAFKAVAGKENVERVQNALENAGKIMRKLIVKANIMPLSPGGRSFQRSSDSSLNLVPDEEQPVVVHELLHMVQEHYPKVFEATSEFLEHRCGKEKFTQLDSLKGGSRYNSNEKGRKDKFDSFFDDPDNPVDAYYCGKVYHGRNNDECLTMGIQALFQDAGKFAEKDPEYFKFIVGVLSGELRHK